MNKMIFPKQLKVDPTFASYLFFIYAMTEFYGKKFRWLEICTILKKKKCMFFLSKLFQVVTFLYKIQKIFSLIKFVGRYALI